MTERAKKLLLLYYKQSRKIRRVSGLPPLTFKAKKAGTLKNYRIYGNTETKTRSYSGSAPLSFPIVDGAVSNYRVYGNTVNGESVGDRTENLFDGEFLQGCWLGADGSYDPNLLTWICTNKLPCKPNTTYTLSFNSANSRWYGFFWFTENGDYILSDTVHDPQTQCHYTATSPSNAAYMAIDIAGYPNAQACITPSDVTDLMLVEGSTAIPYEPYGYKIPITNNSETANIYLDEPLKKSGDNADYIDYAEQKRYNADGTNEDVTLPALPAQSTSNSLSIGTSVQPSSVAVDVDEVVSCGDRTENLWNENKEILTNINKANNIYI